MGNEPSSKESLSSILFLSDLDSVSLLPTDDSLDSSNMSLPVISNSSDLIVSGSDSVTSTISRVDSSHSTEVVFPVVAIMGTDVVTSEVSSEVSNRSILNS